MSRNPLMNIKRCGTCEFAETIAQDISKRICWGAPPSAVQIPLPGGKVTLQMARPVVHVADKACALYQLRETNDAAFDEQEASAIAPVGMKQ